MERNPTRDGASGLHYSGRVYSNEFSQLAGGNVCDAGTVPESKINDIMPNSISSTSISVDAATKRLNVAALETYVNTLITSGKLPDTNNKDLTYDALKTKDTKFYADIRTEYCFYEKRYKAALNKFINLVATATPGTNTTAALNQTITLNKRLNSLLEILNYVGDLRAKDVNTRSPKIVEANTALQAKITQLKEQEAFLKSSDVTTNTQKEMVRYSAEKSRAMNIQIMFFVALNIVALGTIITVYKSIRPSV
jgi:hypothetical protein